MSEPKRSVVILMIEGNESKQTQERLLSSCIALAQYTSADLEVFVPDFHSWPDLNNLSRFRYTPRPKISVTAIGKDSNLVDEVKFELQKKYPLFFVLDRNHFIGKRTKQDRLLSKQVLSEISVPILLMSCQNTEMKVPFLSLFVPMSGEGRMSPALEWAIQFANVMHLPVDLLHVTHQFRGTTDDPSLMGKICDTFYHEYPYLVSEFVSQGSPYSSMHDKKVIRRFIHCTGDELIEIIKCGFQQNRPLVVVDWKGNIERGHAKILKGILRQTDWPILLTKQIPNQNRQNKILKHLRAA